MVRITTERLLLDLSLDLIIINMFVSDDVALFVSLSNWYGYCWPIGLQISPGTLAARAAKRTMVDHH